jgi:hypothetical protein
MRARKKNEARERAARYRSLDFLTRLRAFEVGSSGEEHLALSRAFLQSTNLTLSPLDFVVSSSNVFICGSARSDSCR